MDDERLERYRAVGQKARALSRHLQAATNTIASRIRVLRKLAEGGSASASDREELRFLMSVVTPPVNAAIEDWNTILFLSGMKIDDGDKQ